MSQQAEPAGGRRNDPTRAQRRWSGVIVFAALMMMLLGGLHFLSGLIAVFEEEEFKVGSSDLIVTVDYTWWGVVHLALGVVMVMAGWALFFRRTWARVVTVMVALFSAVFNWVFLPTFPAWYALMLGLDVLVIWAVTVHGDEGGWEEF